jgi:hypothetical protein
MAHSKLFSPSASSRWLTCWASATLNADKERKSNPDADRGTVLHEWMQKNLKAESPDYSSLPAADHADAKVALEAAKTALEDFNDALWLEKEVKVVGLPEVFGTVDLIAYDELEEQLLILDYKFGYGEVDVDMNPQLLIYARGAITTLSLKVKTITLCVIQPQRSKRPDFFTLSFSELEAWATQELEPAYRAIKDGAMSFHVDDTACKWCPSKLECPARNNEVKALFEEIPERAEESIFDKLEMVARLRDWCNAVEAEAEDRLKAGETDSRWKLVRGKSNRRWRDEEAAERWLAARGLKEKERYKWTVIGIPAAEELLAGKLTSTKLKNAFANLIEKPEGKLTYAKAGDKRAAVVVTAAVEIFKQSDDELEDL